MSSTTYLTTTVKMTIELEALINQEGNCLMRLRQIQNRSLLNDTVTAVKLGEVNRVLKQLNEIYDKIENIDPEYVSLRRAKIISLNEIQNMLSYKGRGAVLVEYFVTKHETFIFVYTK